MADEEEDSPVKVVVVVIVVMAVLLALARGLQHAGEGHEDAEAEPAASPAP